MDDVNTLLLQLCDLIIPNPDQLPKQSLPKQLEPEPKRGGGQTTEFYCRNLPHGFINIYVSKTPLSNSRQAANDQPELKFSIVGQLSLSKFAFN